MAKGNNLDRLSMGVKSEAEINRAKERANEVLETIYNHISALSDGSVILYDVIEDFFFQDAHYEMLISNAPMWMADKPSKID